MMSGFTRYHRILNCFISDQSHWSIQALAEWLELPRSTIYRVVRELVQTGFLEASGSALYRLGPAFLAFERRIRESDPFIQSGGIFLPPLVQQAPVPVCAALCRLHGDQVMCVADARSMDFEGSTAYERGKPMPILFGATSKAVLAGLPTKKREKLILESNGEADFDVLALTSQLRELKKQGYLITRGEVDTRLAGVAAVVTIPSTGIYASLTLIVHQADLTPSTEQRLAALVTTHAALITAFMSA